MKIYYLADRETIGPLDDRAFRDALGDGTIMRGTLVWHHGLRTWTPYRDLAPAEQPVPVQDVKDGPVKRYRLACAECGEMTYSDLLIAVDGATSCARCRPLMAQRISEGASPAGSHRFAGLWARTAAKLVDWLIAYAIGGAAFAMLWGASMSAGVGEPSAVALIVLYLVMPLSYAVYSILTLYLLQGTPGKLIFGLRVCTADGQRIRFGRACGRFFAELLTGYSMTIGYLMAGLDDERRTLHDLICGTRVIDAP